MGPAELDVLLNLIPQAVLVVESARNLVLRANGAFLKLTAFTQTEAAGGPLEALVDGMTLEQLLEGQSQLVNLQRRKRTPLVVTAHATMLDVNQQWYLVRFSPPESRLQEVEGVENLLIDKLLALLGQPDSNNLQEAVLPVLSEISGLLETDLVCLYQAEGAFPRLQKIATVETDGQVFPEDIPSSDLARLSNLTVWQPGRRVLTEVHRAGRMVELNYVASVPLGQLPAFYGLLVVGSRTMAPPDVLERLLQIFSAYLNVRLQQGLLLENLREQMNAAENRLEIQAQAIENVKEGVIVLGPNLEILQVNPMAEWLLGYAGWEVKGRLVEDMLIGPDRLMPALELALQGQPTHNLGTTSLHKRNGQAFPAQVQIHPVVCQDVVKAVLIFIVDASEHEQIRERTQQLEQRAILGEFTAIFAHEVRNPINSINAGLELLSSRLPADDPNQEVIAKIQNDCMRLNHRMESVLAFSKPMATRFEPVDVSILIQRLLDRWRPRMARVNVQAVFSMEECCPKVSGDPRTLDQVFTNLISNAVEAMSKTGGTLAVRVGLNRGIVNRPQVEIAVSDTGPGIPDDVRNNIFEPFVTTNPNGTGLGLPITKRIVTAHHGSISMNTFPGGTVFYVFLPAWIGEEHESDDLNRG